MSPLGAVWCTEPFRSPQHCAGQCSHLQSWWLTRHGWMVSHGKSPWIRMDTVGKSPVGSCPPLMNEILVAWKVGRVGREIGEFVWNKWHPQLRVWLRFLAERQQKSSQNWHYTEKWPRPVVICLHEHGRFQMLQESERDGGTFPVPGGLLKS